MCKIEPDILSNEWSGILARCAPRFPDQNGPLTANFQRGKLFPSDPEEFCSRVSECPSSLVRPPRQKCHGRGRTDGRTKLSAAMGRRVAPMGKGTPFLLQLVTQDRTKEGGMDCGRGRGPMSYDHETCYCKCSRLFGGYTVIRTTALVEFSWLLRHHPCAAEGVDVGGVMNLFMAGNRGKWGSQLNWFARSLARSLDRLRSLLHHSPSSFR